MYRCDPQRSGASDTALPLRLAPLWQVSLRGALTPPVSSGGIRYLPARETSSLERRVTYLPPCLTPARPPGSKPW